MYSSSPLAREIQVKFNKRKIQAQDLVLTKLIFDEQVEGQPKSQLACKHL